MALTWKEPWHEQVVQKADYFVIAKVISSDPEKGVTATVIRTLGGNELTGNIKINDFYLLDICSRSGGHGPEFHLDKADTCYFFLKQNTSGGYSIATPTTGFATVFGKKVRATYRHSYHQARVSQEVYEPTMTAIFRKYHNLDYDKIFVNNFLSRYLRLPPAKINEDQMETFFLQHAALETMYHLGLNNNYTLILPFLHDSKNFHLQISAARALSGINTADSKKHLIDLLSDKETENFPKTVAVWTLASYNPKELKDLLRKLASKASEEETGFGGNIMDPRICTRIPSVKVALTELSEQL
ncbi:HEAT repeat domain-containing protein [Hymenobacter sp. YC55]|uniref:HEAT repeat domain-containing protein n=1 Tax=Hymenobacter sp. YC55 TaxID=3034019 RepID=UPI0023FA4AD3|nr:HEAT repeat domain-containing protein [Hymenobacter sp. YC55]